MPGHFHVTACSGLNGFTRHAARPKDIIYGLETIHVLDHLERQHDVERRRFDTEVAPCEDVAHNIGRRFEVEAHIAGPTLRPQAPPQLAIAAADLQDAGVFGNVAHKMRGLLLSCIIA